jgi:hypothetical protein
MLQFINPRLKLRGQFFLALHLDIPPGLRRIAGVFELVFPPTKRAKRAVPAPLMMPDIGGAVGRAALLGAEEGVGHGATSSSRRIRGSSMVKGHVPRASASSTNALSSSGFVKPQSYQVKKHARQTSELPCHIEPRTNDTWR